MLPVAPSDRPEQTHDTLEQYFDGYVNQKSQKYLA